MKHFFTLLVFVFACCALSTTASAQYTAIGARLGSPISASFKFFPSESAAVEAFVGFRSNKVNFGNGRAGWTWINVGALYQIHDDLNLGSVSGLQWYYGGGASVYLWSYDNDFPGSEDYGSATLGLHGNIGLDYTFANAPINLSVDWVPTFLIGDGYSTGFGAGYGAFSVRYILNRSGQ